MPLERAAGPAGPPQGRPIASAIALALGGVALVIAAIIQFAAGRAITTLPSPWITVPFAALAAVAAVVAQIRRERLRVLALAGLGGAVVATVLGYVVVASLVALVALVICLVLAKFM
jgi:hypothetical protein